MTQSVPQISTGASPEILMAGAVGFGEGFIVNLICGGTLVSGLLGGAASSVASVLNNASKPFFAHVFGESSVGRFAASSIRVVAVISAVSFAAAAATSTLPLFKAAVGVNLLATLTIRYLMTMSLPESPFALPRPEWLGPEPSTERSHFDAIVVIPFFV